MKNLLFLMLLISICGLAACKQKCCESDLGITNKEQLKALLDAPKLNIHHIKKGSNDLKNVKVDLIARVNTYSNVYNGGLLGFRVTDPSILKLDSPNQTDEDVSIQIDQLIDMYSIGVEMFDKNHSTTGLRQIRGIVTDSKGPIVGLPFKVNELANNFMSDQDGKFFINFVGSATETIPTRCKIQFFSKNFTTIPIGIITVLTDGSAGTTVIDVAFDDDIKGLGGLE